MRTPIDKTRLTPLSTVLTLPATPAQQPGVVGQDASGSIILTAPDGTSAGLCAGDPTLDIFPPVGFLGNAWVAGFDAADLTGAGGVLTVQGILCDGNNAPVPFGVLDVLASTVALAPVVPAVATGTLGAVRPGYDAGGGAACGVACSVTADAAGAFVFTLTCGGIDTYNVRLRWMHVAGIFVVAVA